MNVARKDLKNVVMDLGIIVEMVVDVTAMAADDMEIAIITMEIATIVTGEVAVTGQVMTTMGEAAPENVLLRKITTTTPRQKRVGIFGEKTRVPCFSFRY